MLILAIAALILSGTTLIGGGYAALKLNQVVNSHFAVFEDFFTSQNDGEASPFTELLGKTGGAIAASVSDSVNSAMAGAMGGAMKGATAELERQAVQDNPVLGIMESMPKSIRKNPLAFMAMQTLLNKHIPAGGAPGQQGSLFPGGNGHNDTYVRKHRE